MNDNTVENMEDYTIEDDILMEESEITLNEDVIDEEEISNDIEFTEDDVSENTNKIDTKVLYIVTDKKIPGLLEYMHGCNLKATDVIYNITEARNEILMQYKHTTMAIIETGTGTFMSTKVRQELIDLLGLADEDNNIIVFYTNDIIKEDTIRAIGKNNVSIEWKKYINTVTCVAEILSLNEIYEIPSNKERDSKDKTKLLNYIGIIDGNKSVERIDIIGLTPDAILANTVESGESIQKYKPNV